MDRGCAVVVLEGQYTLQEARTAFGQSLAPFRDAPARGLVVDVSASAMLEGRSSADLFHSIQLIAAQREAFGGRLVAVARSSLAFGLVRMAGFRAEDLGLEAQVCRDYESAVAWVLSGAPASECE